MTALLPDVLLLVLGIGVLYYGAEWLVRGAARLAASLGVSPIVVGLTVVSFGTSAPELVVSTVAALSGNSDLAIGNVMGSNLANIGLILGLTALLKPLDVQARVVWREMPLMLLVTVALYPLVMEDLTLGRGDGVILLLALGAYLLFVSHSVETESAVVLEEYQDYMREVEQARTVVDLSDVTWVILGSCGLVLGGYAIVQGAVQVASALGVSQVIIGLTVVAVGTSLPELATSVVAAAHREPDIAVGNVIGSNIFNVAAILGVAAVIEPMVIPPSVLRRELPAVIAMSVLVFPFLRTGWRLGRVEGAVLLAAYVLAGVYLL